VSQVPLQHWPALQLAPSSRQAVQVPLVHTREQQSAAFEQLAPLWRQARHWCALPTMTHARSAQQSLALAHPPCATTHAPRSRQKPPLQRPPQQSFSFVHGPPLRRQPAQTPSLQATHEASHAGHDGPASAGLDRSALESALVVAASPETLPFIASSSDGASKEQLARAAATRPDASQVRRRIAEV
jgi:hypothetical protein